MEKELILSVIEQVGEDQKEILDCVGIECYDKLIKRFAGTSIYIAKPNTFEREARNLHLIKDYENGLSNKQLATKYGITMVWVNEIIKKQFNAKHES